MGKGACGTVLLRAFAVFFRFQEEGWVLLSYFKEDLYVQYRSAPC